MVGGEVLYIPPGYVRRVRSLSCQTSLPAPRYTVLMTVNVLITSRRAGVTVKTREAQFGRNPWVGALCTS